METKRLQNLGLAVAVLIFGATHLAAQCTPQFSFSVYNDGSASSDASTIYGYTSTEDTSTLCSCAHSAYTAVAAVYDPNGDLLGDSSESGFSSSVSASTDGVSGDYQASGAGYAYCSCLQGYFGGGGTTYPIAVTICDFSISPGAFSSNYCSTSPPVEQSSLFSANVTPSLSACIPVTGSCSVTFVSGNVELDATTPSTCNITNYSITGHANYFGPDSGYSGTLSLSFNLTLSGQSRQHSSQVGVTCP